MFSPQRTASDPQGQNGLANTDIASTLLSHVAAAASQPPAPAQTPAASAAQGALSSTLHLATSPTSLRELLDTHPVVIANFTNPKTCPPCRAIAPHFERLASLRSSELAGKDVAFVDVDLGVGLGSAAAQEWGVSATPTFVFFLKGAKMDELKGANARELENAVDRWLWQAFPPHPHASLPLPAIRAISTTPILYSQTPNWSSLLGKLLPSIDSSSLPLDQKAAVKTFFEQDVVPFLQTKTLPQDKNFDTLITTFVGHTELLKAHLPLDQVFPVFDLWRMAILDPKVCSLATISTPTSSSAGLLKICTDVVADSPSNVSLPRPYLLTILRLVANCFSFLPLAVLFVSPTSTSRTAFTTFLVDSLLSEDEHTKSAAAAIAFNVASVRHRVLDHRGMQLEPTGEEEGDWVLEVVFAVLEAIKVEEQKEDVRACSLLHCETSSVDTDVRGLDLAVYRLVAALALLLYKSPYYTTELAPNLEVLGARAVLEGKLGLVSKKEVRALVQEVAGQLS